MNRILPIAFILCLSLGCATTGERPEPADGFLKGGDISMLTRFEELGAVYRDDGVPGDLIEIMRANGCNGFRLRLFVDPNKRNGVIQDVPYVAKLARRIKDAGAVFLLDIHYSDTWADPGRQTKPAAWKDLGFEELEARVESYTADVIGALKEAGCLPDMVQVGNEILPGFLWPEGKIDAEEGGWDRFTTLLKAGIRGVRQPLEPGDEVRIMLHVHPGGSFEKTGWFFREVEQREVEYDMIGLSFYPWWHGTIEDLRDNLHRTAEAFGKDIMVVEIAYPYLETHEVEGTSWPRTREGQRQFLEDVLAAVRSTPNGLGKGVLWWYPEAIEIEGLVVWKDGHIALFDEEGNALPVMDAFREE